MLLLSPQNLEGKIKHDILTSNSFHKYVIDFFCFWGFFGFFLNQHQNFEKP